MALYRTNASVKILPTLYRRAFSATMVQCRKMPDPIEHATGLEKRELMAKAAGNDNPFDMRVYKRAPGTKDVPQLIPSAFESRLIGCVCEEDATYINWMWLHKGDSKRCECGHYFKLTDFKPI
ncbi:Cytochrome c oxidase subunit 5B [Chamberlinius hualienensis]